MPKVPYVKANNFVPIGFGPRGTKRKISAVVKQNSCQKNILKKDCVLRRKLRILNTCILFQHNINN